MKHIIIPYSATLDFGSEHSLEVDVYRWSGNDYKPAVEVFLTNDGEKLRIRMMAYESEIRCEVRDDNGNVWEDSCMEFFVRPYDDDPRYVNFEMNPAGAMIMSIGADRNTRNPIIFKYKNELNLETKIEEGFWTVEFEVPFCMLNDIYGKPADTIIDKIYGNFYKCGDKTKYPHFGMWSDIDSEIPDFHRPEFFGTLVLEKGIIEKS
ncbi:MAG: carbohydrate-binding family 9-like protein [Saccharofermentanales bacterium]